MKDRGNFSGRIGFIAAAAGSAIGLGNIWRFPFITGQDGGGAFLIVYLVLVFLICYPVLLAEIAIGRGAQKSAGGAFQSLRYPRWRFIGFGGVICAIIILSFYNIVAGWVFGYIIEILRGNFEIGHQFSDFIDDMFEVAAYSAGFMFLTAAIVSGGVTKGIEKANRILMPMLLVILLFLVIYSLTLPGAAAGLKFYLVPDFSKINIAVIYNALGQGFFSLSLGMGTMLTYGSYLRKKENIISSGVVITLADFSIAFLAGLMIFPMVFNQGISTQGGPGLIFITMPGVFKTMGPVLGIIIGALFFILLAFAALTSTISLLELPVSYLVDQKNMNRKLAAWISAVFVLICSIPSMLANGYSPYFTHFIKYFGSKEATDFMTFIGDVSSNTLLPLGGLLISVFSVYVWKRHRLFRELSRGNENFMRSFLAKYLNFTLRYTAPILLGIIFIVTILELFFGVRIEFIHS